MKKALIHVDYTHDFVAENGALTTGQPGQAIYDDILAITQSFMNQGEYIVFAIDTHHTDDPFHPETKLFPPHNIEGSDGHQLYAGLEDYYQTIKDAHNVHYMPKQRYSAFAGTDLDLKLRERGITDITIVGVCTDICVLHTAVDAYNKGYHITIPKSCVASFNPQGHDFALQHFKGCLGADII